MTHLVLSTYEASARDVPIELRCDETIPPFSLRPFILTSKNLELIPLLAERAPEYLDIPSHAPLALFRDIRERFPKVKIIASFHDYEKTPGDLDALWEEMRQLPADALKIVTHASSSLDGLRMLAFLQKRSDAFPLTAFCMGEKGVFTRILQPVFGGLMSYCCEEEKIVAPGQLSIDEMEKTYHFHTLSRKTAIYALIGQPVSHSFGHRVHNALFEKRGEDSVYVKIELARDECPEALQLFSELQFQGLSITMPLKQVFFEEPYNTAVHKGTRWEFFNTDGSGALDFLGDVTQKKVLIYGAGATAEAIGREAKKRGADVFFHNRTKSRGEALAQKIGAQFIEEPFSSDFTVNATPVALASPVSLDVNLTSDTGKEMWLRQAAKQQALWRSGRKCIQLPPSKSQTLRAILFAALADGVSTIDNVLDSADAAAMIAASQALGAQIEKKERTLIIRGIGKKRTILHERIDAGNSGIVLRFVGAVAALFSTKITISGDASIKTRRSCKPLIDGLQQFHAKVSDHPLTVQGPIQSGAITIDGEDSQPVSGLLIAASLLENSSTITVHNGGERPWIELTLDWLRKQGVTIQEKNPWTFEVAPVASFSPFRYSVPGDLSQLAYLVAAALITTGKTTLLNVDLNDLQGDKVILSIFEKMGASFSIDGTTLEIVGPQMLHGIDVDINSCIDMVTILAVMGCYATGETRIRGASIARDKESNRLEAMVTELKKMGATIQETEDGLHMCHSKLYGAALYSHNDHRVVMALAIASLFANGPTTISGIECIKKTYPEFFLDLECFR